MVSSYGYYGSLIRPIRYDKGTDGFSNFLPVSGKFGKQVKASSDDSVIGLGDVGKHDFIAVFEFVQFSGKALCQDGLHIIELSSLVGQIPKHVFYHLEGDLSTAYFVEHFSHAYNSSFQHAELLSQLIQQRDAGFRKLPYFLSTEECCTAYLPVGQDKASHVNTKSRRYVSQSLGRVIKFFVRNGERSKLLGVAGQVFESIGAFYRKVPNLSEYRFRSSGITKDRFQGYALFLKLTADFYDLGGKTFNGVQ